MTEGMAQDDNLKFQSKNTQCFSFETLVFLEFPSKIQCFRIFDQKIGDIFD